MHVVNGTFLFFLSGEKHEKILLTCSWKTAGGRISHFLSGVDTSCVCLQYIASSWNHDGDPVELLQINESVSLFRQALKENPHFLQDKVRQYFKVTETNCCDFFFVCVCVIISCPLVQMAKNIF